MGIFKKIKDSGSDSYTVPDAYDESAREHASWQEAEDLKHPCDEAGNPAAPRNRRRSLIIWTVVILFAVLGVAFWLRYLNPYVTNATEVGYVTSIEQRGVFFKTWEGQLVPSNVMDVTPGSRDFLYQREFTFSVDDEAVARSLQDMKNSRQQVKVTYRRYFGTLPWRGSSTIVVTSAEPISDW